MEIFENIFTEMKSYRKILQVTLYLINEKRYDDAKMMMTRVLTQKEIQEPIKEVLKNGDTDKKLVQVEEGRQSKVQQESVPVAQKL